jgi:hypothetical protein
VFKAAEATEGLIGVPHLLTRNEESDEWRIGVSIRFNPPNHFPPLTVAFGVFITERDSQFTVRIGTTLKAQVVNLADKSQREAFIVSLVKEIKESFDEPSKSLGGKYGFQSQTS